MLEKQKSSHLRFHLLLLLLLLDGPFNINGRALKIMDVGVVLDKTSWIGNISWTCMQQAVEDFYNVYPKYITKLDLKLRESGRDAFGATSAVVDLLKNVHVQAIIGPQKSTQAKFVIELGDKTHVPIISFSATSPSLSTIQSPYFIRTALNDSTQAEVVASIIQRFKWKQVVPICEDSDYGAGIVPYLVDALQERGARVSYRSTIPLLASKQRIQEELSKLNNLQTRVFIVHMSYSLGLRLFQIAEKMKMMGEGYVWIITYGLTDLLDLASSSATSVMKGVIGLKPYVEETHKLTVLKRRWKTKFDQSNPGSLVTEPIIYGLWAYDTVWSLALAAESVHTKNSTFLEQKNASSSSDLATLGISQNGPELLSMIRNTSFDGASGKFHLIDGQLEPQAFEIINVLGQGYRRIGFWTPAYGASRYIGSKAHLQVLEWPGESKKVPKGWEWPTMGKKLRIGVPVSPGFNRFVDWKADPDTHSKGFCIQVFEEVINSLPYKVPFEYVSFVNATGQPNGTYDDLVYQVYLQTFDAVVGDVTILANRSLYVDFTLPFTESGVSMLVPIKDKNNKSAWIFTEPLTSDLWLASFFFFVFTGFVVWSLEHRINDEFRGTTSHQIGTVFYFTFSTLVFAHREAVTSNLSRVVVIIWVFVVLILTQSYTATLTSILTVEQLQPTVTDLNDLLRNGASVGYAENSFILSLLTGMNFRSSNLIAYSSPLQYNEALSNGSVAAIVDEIPYLKVFLSQYCKNYTMVGPTYKSGGFGFVFPRGSPLVPEVSRKILKVIEKKVVTLENILYGNNICPDKGDVVTNSSSLSFTSFWGLFLLTGVTSLLAIFLHIVFFLYEQRDILRSQDVSENTNFHKLALLFEIYRQKGNDSRATEEIDVDRPVTADIMPSPDTIHQLQSPSAMSSYTNSTFAPEEEFGSPLESEGTPGREISAQNPDPPSFADMAM